MHAQMLIAQTIALLAFLIRQVPRDEPPTGNDHVCECVPKPKLYCYNISSTTVTTYPRTFVSSIIVINNNNKKKHYIILFVQQHFYHKDNNVDVSQQHNIQHARQRTSNINVPIIKLVYLNFAADTNCMLGKVDVK